MLSLTLIVLGVLGYRRLGTDLYPDVTFPFNVVPVDYVVRAILHLSRDPRAVGRTFHLVDPNPTSARKGRTP